MPLSPPSVRPVLAALLTVLLIVAPALASPLATAGAAAGAAGPAGSVGAPAAPPPLPDDTPISMDLVSLDPASLSPGGTVTAQVEVTNTSSEPLSDPVLELRGSSSRVTEREAISQWQADSSPDVSSEAISRSGPASTLAPGQSVTLSVEATAEELGYSDEPYYWGARRISLTVVADEQPLAAIRSFVVWRPEGAEDSITQSVLLPIASRDAAEAISDPPSYGESVESGRLGSLLELAQREDVDWWLDPALLDPPMLPQDVDTEEGTESDAEQESAEPTPQPAVTYEPEPAATGMATALEESVGGRTVLAMPYARTDLESVHAAGATELARAAEEQGEAAWEESGIVPRAMALGVPSEQAGPQALQQVRTAGASAAIVPASSLRTDPSATVTPSSIALHRQAGSGEDLPLLAPDPELSAEFSQLTGQSDAEQTRQRLLAETATIAAEYTTAPRHLLIVPDPDVDLDASAAGDALDALGDVPWIETGRTAALLDAAAHRDWVSDTQDDSGALYAEGEVDDAQVLPSGPGEDDRYAHLAEAEDPQLTDPAVLDELTQTWSRLDTLGAAMKDDAALQGPRLTTLSGASIRWREDPEVPAQRAEQAADLTATLDEAIEVAPASEYNLISDTAPVPITVTNGLDTRIRVRIQVSSDRPLVHIEEQPVVEVPARGQVETTVPVSAIANGTVTLTSSLTTEDGRSLTEPVEVPLTVNPAWENWTTMLVVIAMSLLVVVGVARARRTGAATRAPAMRGPEDPEELARSGRSAPLEETSPPPTPGPPDTGTSTDHDTDEERP